jgi:hypothetical protein
MAQVKLGHVEETSDRISSHLGWGFTLSDEHDRLLLFACRPEQGRKEMGRVLSTAAHVVFT